MTSTTKHRAADDFDLSISNESSNRTWALDQVFAEIAQCEVPRHLAEKQPAPVPQSTPAGRRPGNLVARQLASRMRASRVDNDKPGWTYHALKVICVACLAFGATVFYRGIPPSWRTTVSPFAESEATTAGTGLASPGTRETGMQTKPIQDVRVGDRLVGRNPIREQADGGEPDPATWRKINLFMTKESGLGLWIELLRPLTWIEEHHAKPGNNIFIDLFEMGAVGDAQVTHLGPCPEIQPGSGTVVIGTFKHQADESAKVVHLRLEDQVELTGVTANHPYWSEDRQDFVEASSLRIGERVDTEYGLKRVVSVTPIDHNDYLYNLETTEHAFRVGSLGTLVHNFCVHRITPDAQGRVRSAIAHITPADLGTGTATNSATRASARALGGSADDAGHLIGRLLGGPGGKRAGNFFAQNPHINRGQFAQIEKSVAGYVRNGHDVWIRVTPQYAGQGARATGVLYQVRVDGETIISELFGN